MTSVPPSKSVPPKVQRYRAAGKAGVFIITGLCAWAVTTFPAHAPWIVIVAQGAVWWIGTTLGIPAQPIVQLALAMLAASKPGRALEITSEALRSLPPDSAGDAARVLQQSLRPSVAGSPVMLVPDPDNPLSAPPPAGPP